MKLEKIDQPTCRTLSREIETALQGVAEKFGIHIRTVGGRFSSTEYNLRVECQVRTEAGIPVNFEIEAKLLGLPEGIFGKTFVSRGRTFRITGIELRRHKMPVSAKCVSTGRGFKFSADAVRFALSGKVA